MIRSLLTAFIASSIALAQSPQLRLWPESGGWIVALVRATSLSGAPACLLMTGYETVGSPQSRIWGLRAAKSELLSIISVIDSGDIAGDEVEILFDNYSLGHFPVTERFGPVNEWYTEYAPIKDLPLQRRVFALIQLAEKIAFAGRTVEVQKVLDRAASRNFDECLRELALLE